MDFSDNKHTLATLAFHGATEVDPEQICTQDVIQALATWATDRTTNCPDQIYSN